MGKDGPPQPRPPQLGQTSAQIGHAVAGPALSTGSSILGNISKQQIEAGGSGMAAGIASAVLGVASIIQNFFFRPDLNKIATTEIVDKAEQLLQQNLAAWNSLPASQKTPATQAQAIQNFDTVWAQVVQACGAVSTEARARRVWRTGSAAAVTTRAAANAGTGSSDIGTRSPTILR